jgi:hypothetical protein
MQVIPVESTALATVGYDEARELLRVEFCGRAIYHYFPQHCTKDCWARHRRAAISIRRFEDGSGFA